MKPLFEKYNTPGSFPFVVVFDKRAKILGTTGYKDVTPQDYIAHLNTFIPQKEKAQKVF